MKKIIKFFQQKYILVFACVAGVLFGFALMSFIFNSESNTANVAVEKNMIVAAGEPDIPSGVTCTSYSCNDGLECGAVCCTFLTQGGSNAELSACANYDAVTSQWGPFIGL